MKRIAFVLLAIMIACSNGMARTILVKIGVSGFAQNERTSVTYSGHIAGVAGEAVEYATVILLQEERQKAGAVTDNQGNFTVEANTGSYTLVVQCVGYEPMRKSVVLPAARRDSVVLKTSAFSLKEVVVQARNIERKADRFVMVVPSASGKDGTELLAEAPEAVWFGSLFAAGRITVCRGMYQWELLCLLPYNGIFLPPR